MIGAKSITTAVLLVGMAVVAWGSGALNQGVLTRLDPWLAAGIGVFACVAGSLLYRLWGLNRGSLTGLRIRQRDSLFDTQITLVDHLGGRILIGGSTEAPPRDFPAVVQRAFLIGAFVLLGLCAFDNRSLGLMDRWPGFAGHFCDEIETADSTPRSDAQGCELVRRAYRLGYAKSLGSCAPEDDQVQAAICTLRHRDEPYLHYAWRLLASRSQPVFDLFSVAAMREFKERFVKGLGRLGVLYQGHKDAISTAPRAVHHLWTNLPDPQGGWLGSATAHSPVTCQAQTDRIADRWNLTQPAGSDSLLLERVLGLLLFDPRYSPIVGVCGEYRIHWNAPVDACARLAEDPGEFLDQSDALASTERVLDRCRRAYQMGKECRPERVVSFQCLIQNGPGPERSRKHNFTFQGGTFVAAEARFPLPRAGDDQAIAMAQRLAALLAPGFYYGRLMSRKSPTRQEEGISFQELFKGGDFLLSKLEYLRDADPFLGPVELGSRTDLQEVFPYHLHARTFVEVFRRQYQRQRGRL